MANAKMITLIKKPTTEPPRRRFVDVFLFAAVLFRDFRFLLIVDCRLLVRVFAYIIRRHIIGAAPGDAFGLELAGISPPLPPLCA